MACCSDYLLWYGFLIASLVVLIDLMPVVLCDAVLSLSLCS